MMLEREVRVGRKSRYVTSPTSMRAAQIPFAPSRWMIVSRGGSIGILPLEFSEDPLVIEQHEEILSRPAAIGEIGEFLQTSRVGDLIGLAVAQRKRKNSDARSRIPRENIPDPSQSVVEIVPRKSPDFAKSIPTVWITREPNGCCSLQTVCENQGCEPGENQGHWHTHIERREHIGCA